jgi:hypothetical protein
MTLRFHFFPVYRSDYVAYPMNFSTPNVRIRVVIVGVIVVALFGILFSTRSPELFGKVSPLKVEVDTLDFGYRWAHEPFDWKVSLHNQSESSLRIEKVEASCSCTSLLRQNLDIGAGSQIELPFRISPQSEKDAVSLRRFASPIAVFVNGQEGSLQFEIQGVLRRLATLEPDELYFGRVFQEISAEATRECVLQSSFSLASVSVVDSDKTPFDIQIASVSSADDRYLVVVSPKAELPIGAFDSRVLLNCVLYDNFLPPPPPLRMRITGEIVGDIVSEPSRFDLGVIHDSQNDLLELRLQSRKHHRFIVVNQIERPTFLGKPIISGSATTSDVRLSLPLVLSNAGPFAGVVVVPVRLDDGNVQSVRIPVSGYLLARLGDSFSNRLRCDA